jgi:hypothetical protein
MRVVLYSLLLLGAFAAALANCAAACPVLDLAATACPLIVVLLPDGTKETVSRDEFAKTAMKVRGSRLLRASDPDAGAGSD